MASVKPLSAPQKALHKLGLDSPLALALHLPFRYEDDTQLSSLRTAQQGEPIQFEAEVLSHEVVYRPKRQLKVEVLSDGLTCTLRFFNFYPSQLKQFQVGVQLRLKGEIRGGMFGLSMMHPVVQIAGAPLPQTLTPIYASSAGLAQSYIRKAVLSGLKKATELGLFEPSIPASLEPEDLWPLKEALQFLHMPEQGTKLHTLEDQTHPAWRRLKAEELLAQQLSQMKARLVRSQVKAPALKIKAKESKKKTARPLVESLREQLPFQLTNAQTRVLQEIASDLVLSTPMHRLLQGDVGSGKTVVAALAAAQCIDAGWQCALMAPTEILAHQHFEKLSLWLEPLLGVQGLKVAWLTGSQKKKDKTQALIDIEQGQAALVIGTHAIIQEQVKFKHLGLAIIDEQHRFGVEQRLTLRKKSKPTNEQLGERFEQTAVQVDSSKEALEPHLLMMSATPIPRTLAMSYFADLDVSTLDELPPGRTPVVTKLFAEHKRQELIERVKYQILQGFQVYWVCPLIEESETMDLSNATQTHMELAQALEGLGDEHGAKGQGLSKDVHVGLLHSKMHEQDKKAVMQAFKEGKIQVLVSTTVIEVGVDVPNASLMVIEHAERFGLSQLHQLRGRVGRGSAASTCVLLYALGEHGRLSETASQRLKAMLQTQDGFEIAKRDLEIRGPGEFLGARQSGASLLRYADPLLDMDLMQWAQSLAPTMWSTYPQMALAHLARWQTMRSEYLKA
ncbi:MAG: ATP-dependent DNA helicase RecG [Betaproteobacteria bacterium]